MLLNTRLYLVLYSALYLILILMLHTFNDYNSVSDFYPYAITIKVSSLSVIGTSILKLLIVDNDKQ